MRKPWTAHRPCCWKGHGRRLRISPAAIRWTPRSTHPRLDRREASAFAETSGRPRPCRGTECAGAAILPGEAAPVVAYFTEVEPPAGGGPDEFGGYRPPGRRLCQHARAALPSRGRVRVRWVERGRAGERFPRSPLAADRRMAGRTAGAAGVRRRRLLRQPNLLGPVCREVREPGRPGLVAPRSFFTGGLARWRPLGCGRWVCDSSLGRDVRPAPYFARVGPIKCRGVDLCLAVRVPALPADNPKGRGRPACWSGWTTISGSSAPRPWSSAGRHAAGPGGGGRGTALWGPVVRAPTRAALLPLWLRAFDRRSDPGLGTAVVAAIDRLGRARRADRDRRLALARGVPCPAAGAVSPGRQAGNDSVRLSRRCQPKGYGSVKRPRGAGCQPAAVLAGWQPAPRCRKADGL